MRLLDSERPPWARKDHALHRRAALRPVLCACGAGLAASLLFATPDSQLAQSQRILQLTEDLRIDGKKEDFSVVGTIQVHRRGDVAIAFPQDGTVRIYNAYGRRAATVGQRGNGPNEFRDVAVEGWRGDTIWAVDRLAHRITFVAIGGKVLRTELLPKSLDRPAIGTPPVAGGLRSRFTPRAMSLDGAMLGTGMVAVPRGSATIDVRAIVRVHGDATPKIIAIVPEQDTRWHPSFGYRPQLALSPNGTRVAYVQVDGMSGVRGSFTLSVFGSGGDTLMMKSFPYTGVRIPRRVADSLSRSGRRDGPDARGAARRVMKDSIPPIFPPVRGVLIGHDESVWITIRESADIYSVFVVDDISATKPLAIPARSRVVAATATHLWMLERDVDDVESVVRYRVQRSRN